MKARADLWLKSFAAVVLGNVLYFYLLPSLPPPAQHQRMKLDLGVLVDLWFCLCMYGLVEGGMQLSRWLRKNSRE
ncbi:MAG: hypothetical protein ABSG54_15035 [Terriglobia bacterium]|jgi:hypothetical protein